MKEEKLTTAVDVAIPLMLSAMAVAALATAHSYSRASGIFPLFIGWIFLALSVLEFALRLTSMLREKSAAKPAREVGPATPPGARLRELGGFLWLGALLGVLYAGGFLVATPLFMFAFLYMSARRTLRQSLVVASLATAFIYVVFVWLLDYRLYGGILLSG